MNNEKLWILNENYRKSSQKAEIFCFQTKEKVYYFEKLVDTNNKPYLKLLRVKDQ